MDKAIAKSAAKGIFKIFSISFLALFIIIELIQIVYLGIQTKSFQPILTELGGKFLYSTQQLSNESKQLIAQGGVPIESINLTINPISGIWGVIKELSNFFTIIYTVFIWLKILTWLFGHSPFSNTSNAFKNVMFAIFIFLFLQSALITTTAAIQHNIDCFSGCGDKSVSSYLLTPVLSFKDFFQAIPYIIKPISQVANTVKNAGL